MIQKVLRAIVAFALSIALIPATSVHATDYSDTTYWSKYCSNASNAGSSACKGYIQYLQTQSASGSKQLKQIEAQKDEIAANLAKYDAQLKDLQKQVSDKQAEIDAKQKEIDAKQAEIDAKQKEIDAKQEQIDETQSQIDALKEKIKERMVNAQPSMKTSQYIDILMGAKTFEDFIRIANGLNSITQYDKNIQNQLTTLVDQLNSQKKELEDDKKVLENDEAALEVSKAEMVSEQNELKDLEAQTQVIINEQEKQAASLEAEGKRITSNLSQISKILSSVGEVAAASGWTYPVPGSHRSAGTWTYPGGGAHLGYDFAATAGTQIHAVGNGVVINSANGCPTYGGLGSTCGSQYGGSQGGGNQVYLLVKVNGSLYAVKYLHMMINTPIAIGTTVTGGDVIGRVGSSGNSSGPHCHIEIFYLGDASNYNNYKNTWNGDLAFGAGWAGSDRKCDAGYGAPCRIRPESVFGS